MAIKPIARYNEPQTRPRGDRVPAGARVISTGLDRMVRARFEIERELRVCANEPQPPRRRFGALHERALLAMLSELDSPLSASLRARAAAAVGSLKRTSAARRLRVMALDDDEDLLTRVNAAGAYVEIRGQRAAAELSVLLRAREPLVRTAVYVAALKAGDKLAEAAERRFRTERDPRVKASVLRRVPQLKPGEQTRED